MTFGYKTAWIAARSTDTPRVIRALGVRGAAPSGDQAGVDASYEDDGSGYGRKVFIAGPIAGWTLAVSVGLLRLADDNPPKFGDWIARLSAELECEVQFFSTHRVVEAHCWAQASDGKLRRAYGYSGSAGEVAIDFGEKTPAEVALGFAFFDGSTTEAQSDGYWERQDLRFPDEEGVMNLAARWSVNPSALTAIGDGFLGELADFASEPIVAEPPAPPRSPWWRFW